MADVVAAEHGRMGPKQWLNTASHGQRLKRPDLRLLVPAYSCLGEWLPAAQGCSLQRMPVDRLWRQGAPRPGAVKHHDQKWRFRLYLIIIDFVSLITAMPSRRSGNQAHTQSKSSPHCTVKGRLYHVGCPVPRSDVQWGAPGQYSTMAKTARTLCWLCGCTPTGALHSAGAAATKHTKSFTVTCPPIAQCVGVLRIARAPLPRPLLTGALWQR